MTPVMFFIAATAAIAGAIGVVLVRNPFYSVLALVCHLLALAALFLLLRAEFVAASQVVVYAGAVMVLYVFVVAYVGGGEDLPSAGALKVLGPVFAFALVIELLVAMLGTGLKGVAHEGKGYFVGFGGPHRIGEFFLTKFLFPFEVASLLLLVAAVGAVVLARRRRGLEGDEDYLRTVYTPRSLFTGTMAEGVGTRTGATAPAVEQTERAGSGRAVSAKGGS